MSAPSPNHERSARIARMLHRDDAYESVSDDLRSVLTDLLADARHFADVHGLEYGECDRTAYRHYTDEKSR